MLDFVTMPINPETPRLFNVVSTFAGCGGSSLGYKWAGGKVLAAIEWDENAVATYRLNHKGTPVLHRDIATVSVEEVLEITGLHSGELDIFDGSPPCQGFSTAGKRQIDDPRNSLFKEYVRLLRGLQPKVFVMENVSGMVKGDMKHVFAIAMRELKASGYSVKCQLLNAMYFGVPQSRERVIFIGVRNDLGIAPNYPRALMCPITVKQAYTALIADILGKHPPKPSPLKIKRWNETKRGGNHYERFSLSRLAWNEPSPTIQKTATGSSGLMHPDEPRELYEGELKRLASFPDDFQFIGKWEDALARIGNTVPPKFMQAIASHIYSNILSKIAMQEVAHV